MYEGYLQHDAQEVLQCILGYVQEACDTIRKEQELEKGGDDNVTEVKMENSSPATESKPPTEEDVQVTGKRKSDTEVGNAKKKPKSVKAKKSEAAEEDVGRNKPFTRSKRKSSSDISIDSTQNKDGEEEEGMKKQEKEGECEQEGNGEKASNEADGKRKKRSRLSWLRPSGKQPSIFSKFRSVGKISSSTVKSKNKAEEENEVMDEQTGHEASPQSTDEEKNAVKHEGKRCLL